jgi:hypothetical protein
MVDLTVATEDMEEVYTYAAITIIGHCYTLNFSVISLPSMEAMVDATNVMAPTARTYILTCLAER